MTDEQFYEMGEQFRDIKRLLLGRERPMIASDMKVKVNGLFDRILAKYKGLPFGGKYVNALRSFVIDNIDLVKVHVDKILSGEDFDASVKALMMIAKGHLPLGWPWSWLADTALSSIEKWMLDKNNREHLKEWIGEMPVQG